MNRRDFIKRGALWVPLAPLIRPVLLHAATAWVQDDVNGTFDASGTVILGSNVTVNNALGVFIVWSDVTRSLTGVTDTRSSTYTLLNNPTTGAFQRAAWAYTVLGSSGANTIAASFSGTGNMTIIMLVHEVSGIDTGTPVGANQSAIQEQTTPGTGTDGCTSGSITTARNGCYIMGVLTDEGWASTITTGTGYTTRANSSGDGVYSESQVQSSAGAIAATFTTSNGSNQHMTGVLAFQPPAAAGGANPRRRVIRL